MNTVQQIVVFGLTSGIIYALIALGFTLVLGILGIANFAHGALVMLAMYGALIGSDVAGLNPFVSMLIVVPIMFAIGLVVYRGMVKPLLGRDHTVHVAATIGLLLVVENLVNLFYGGTVRNVKGSFGTGSVPVLGVYIPSAQLIAAGIAALAVLALYLVLSRTDFGLSVRACADNLVGARVSGVRVNRMFAIAFGLSVAAAGLAGAMIASYQPMDPFVGADFLSIAFAVVILAGAGNILGTIASGLIIGLIGTAAQVGVSSSLSNPALFVIIILVLFLRPEGLFSRA